MSGAYGFGEIERRWQETWERGGVFRAANPGEPGGERPKFYVLDFFPYPSGAGLHVGHPLGYIATDIVARHKRMRGFNVLHPMGWDAFGLPAEQFAIETGVHPAITTQKNIETYRRQLKAIGFSYDWSREIATCDESYYRWTQWIFLHIYNSWYDPECAWTDRCGRSVVGKARHIDELPIPAEVRSHGPAAIEEYQAEHRLAYLAEVPVNWCPALGTVLSNEEVTNEGRSDRGDHPVYRRPMKQWMLRITEYADRLLADLAHLDWPEPIKLMQRNWIGRSEGAYVDFELDQPAENGPRDVIRVFTTRPDTLFGATYMVLAPEHRLVSIITTPERRAVVNAYVEQARHKSDLDRSAESKVKTGVFTGAHAINPVSRQRVPIWVADYVLMGYGTGSIMAVPGHDRRDLEFAETFGLPVIQVVESPAGEDWRGFEGDGVSCHSPGGEAQRFAGQCDLNGLPTPQAKRRIIAWLEQRELGEGTIQYKLRDWLFSRQRYWGEPFPILHTPDGRIVALDERELPVRLPPMDDFKPVASDDPMAEPQTPLSRAGAWLHVSRDGKVLRREPSTMPQWAGSCWYYLRFCDPANERALVDPAVERYWMAGGDGPPDPKRVGGIDLYLGGAEHAVLHLLYARFWHKVLYDLGFVSTPEPFQRLFNQGMIGAAAYRDDRGVYIEPSRVVDAEGRPAAEAADPQGPFFCDGRPATREIGKMGKSLKNVVNPDEIIREYGADTLRLYEMSMGPLEASKPWNTRDIIGVHRFLHRVWRLAISANDESAPSAWSINPKVADVDNPKLERPLHKTIRKVGEDIETFSFNTAIAAMIEFVNEATKAESIGRAQLRRFLLILSPFAPHICEELWQRLGGADAAGAARSSMAWESWPAYDEALTRDAEVEIMVQINSKNRQRIMAPADASEEQLLRLACEAVRSDLGDRPVRKSIVRPGRLVNLVV
ncbi:MAG: Leucine--tRNA ligase [Phycisphaerae bacterium]|nr:Leucine--tRNA ligase [Phycisphaerae bacterium]